MSEQIPAQLDEVGPGWHPLLLRLHERLLAVNPGYRVSQVKEKYGTLRLYLVTGLLGHAGPDLDRWPSRPSGKASGQSMTRPVNSCAPPRRSRPGPASAAATQAGKGI